MKITTRAEAPTMRRTWFPFERRDFRVNAMGLYVYRSPVGYTAYPVPVGANGFTFLTDVSLAF